MRVVTSNIMNNPDIPRAKVRSAAVRTAKHGGVAFFQEIQEREDHVDIELGMGRKFSWVAQHLAIPIAFKSKLWELIEHGDELMHHGKELTSPARFVSWAVLRKRSRVRRGAPTRRRKVLCFMNTHFVSGAWNDKPKRNKDWRKLSWLSHFAKMRHLVQSFIARGISVVFGGDFNKSHVDKFHPDQRWLAVHGIDKIGFVPAPGGTRVKVLRTGHVDVSRVKDHKAVWASLYVRAA